MRDGILPASLFDDPINTPGVPQPLVVPKPAPPPPPPSESSSTSNALPPAGADGKPPPGMSLMEEMKWRQANRKQQAAANDPKGDDGIKIRERGKSTLQPQRMVALKPVVTSSDNKVTPPAPVAPPSAALLKPTSPKKDVETPKYSNPTYEAKLKPAARRISIITGVPPPPAPVQKVVSTEKPLEKIEEERPKVDIEYMPAPSESLLPKRDPLETIKLEDGTMVTRDVDGGLTQENPNGVIIRQFADGSTRQTNVDGVIIETSADGTKIVQTNPDGSRIEAGPELTITFLPDGVILKNFENGEKHQVNTDGVEIKTYPDGKKVQWDPNNNVELTTHPDGSIDQVDKATGKKLHVSPDGVVTQL